MERRRRACASPEVYVGQLSEDLLVEGAGLLSRPTQWSTTLIVEQRANEGTPSLTLRGT